MRVRVNLDLTWEAREAFLEIDFCVFWIDVRVRVNLDLTWEAREASLLLMKIKFAAISLV